MNTRARPAHRRVPVRIPEREFAADSVDTRMRHASVTPRWSRRLLNRRDPLCVAGLDHGGMRSELDEQRGAMRARHGH